MTIVVLVCWLFIGYVAGCLHGWRLRGRDLGRDPKDAPEVAGEVAQTQDSDMSWISTSSPWSGR